MPLLEGLCLHHVACGETAYTPILVHSLCSGLPYLTRGIRSVFRRQEACPSRSQLRARVSCLFSIRLNVSILCLIRLMLHCRLPQEHHMHVRWHGGMSYLQPTLSKVVSSLLYCANAPLLPTSGASDARPVAGRHAESTADSERDRTLTTSKR